MRRVFAILVPAILLLAPGAYVRADDADKVRQKELTALEGTWELTDLLIDGKERPIAAGVKIWMILREGKQFTLALGEQVLDQGTFTIDPAANPGQFDTTSVKDGQKQETQPGIYELRDDVLKTSFATTGKKRPANFVATAGNGFDLQTFKRLTWEKDPQKTSHWLAFVEGPPAVLRMILTLERKGDQIVSGSVDIPDARLKGMPLGTVHNTGRKLSIVSPSKAQTIEGEIAPDGRGISATMKMGADPKATSLPLTFTRLDKVPDFFTRPQEPTQPFPYEAEDVVVENKVAGIKLAGTLTRPKVKEPVAAVVLVSMSGPQDRDGTEFGHKPYLVLADYLTRKGVAVLRCDDRGVGKSTGKFLGATSADFAADAKAAVEYLKTRKEIASGKIGLLGHSEGGVVAPLVATQSKDVAFVILLGGPALPGDETALIQTPLMMRTFGWPEKRINFNVALQRKLIAGLKDDKDNAAAGEKIRQGVQEEYSKLGNDDQRELLSVKTTFEGVTNLEGLPWHRWFLQHDPRPTLALIRCPVLALFGEKDIQVPPQHHRPEMEKALRASGNMDATVKTIPQVNHMFQKCTFGSIHEYCALNQTMAPEVLELIADWINQKAGTKE